MLLAAALLAGGCKGNVNDLDPVVAVTDRVSVTAAGAELIMASFRPSVSADGRTVAFVSMDPNLAAGDTNSASDVFVKDLLTGAVELISFNAAETAPGNGASSRPSISANGQFVAFESVATDLIGSDTNGISDIFVRDRLAGTTVRVSVDSTGGEIVAFGSGFDLGSFGASISADGSFVSFLCDSIGVTAETVPGGIPNAFRAPNPPGAATLLVSITTAGVGAAFSVVAASISGDGQFVAFTAYDTDLVIPATSFIQHIFVRDVTGATTELISQSTAGVEGNDNSDNPQITPDGTRVVFQSGSTNLAPDTTGSISDIFVRDRTGPGTTSLVSIGANGLQGTGGADFPSISPDGRFVVFRSGATNLVAGDNNGLSDVFWRDLFLGVTRRVSVRTYGGEANGPSTSQGRPVLSADGRFVVFDSEAFNLVGSDTNGVVDVFVRGPIH